MFPDTLKKTGPHFLLSVLLLLGLAGGGVGCQLPPQKELPQVILKLDDAWFEGDSIHLGWVRTFDYLNSKNVVATIGIVGERMEQATPAYYAWMKRQAGQGHEIWNHGYCHCKPIMDGKELREFRGTEYSYQLEHLQKTQRIAAERLNIELETFGAPYNGNDGNTARALTAVPALKTWLYPPKEWPAELFGMPRIEEVNIEYPVHQPDFDAFVAGFKAHLDEPVLVIQGHPRSWLEPGERFVEFQRIIEFLLQEGVRFTTPSDYRKSFN